MGNYSEFLKQEAKEEEQLKVLEQLEQMHFSDKKIMTILQVNVEQLKSLREKRAAVTAD